MLRSFAQLPILLACALLVLPPGWCCAVGLRCCEADAQATPAPCCRGDADTQDPDSEPSRTPCPACSEREPALPAETSVKTLDAPVQAEPFVLSAPYSLAMPPDGRAPEPRPPHPPRHVLLCVWQC